MKQWIKLTDKQLQKELASAKETYGFYADRWLGNEVMGRVLYWMADPAAEQYLKRAIELRSMAKQKRGVDYLILGNYCRMAGDSESAYAYFLQAYEKLKQEIVSELRPGEFIFSEVRNFVAACFLVGHYEEAVEYGTLLREKDGDFNPELIYEQFTLLAEARLHGNLEKAELAADNLNWSIYAKRTKLTSNGALTLWDAYDIALQTVAELQVPTP
jgi:hypothetical protein